MRKQSRQQLALLGRAQRERAVFIDNLERSQDAELDHYWCPSANATTKMADPRMPGHIPLLDRFSTSGAHRWRLTDRTRRSASEEEAARI